MNKYLNSISHAGANNFCVVLTQVSQNTLVLLHSRHLYWAYSSQITQRFVDGAEDSNETCSISLFISHIELFCLCLVVVCALEQTAYSSIFSRDVVDVAGTGGLIWLELGCEELFLKNENLTPPPPLGFCRAFILLVLKHTLFLCLGPIQT